MVGVLYRCSPIPPYYLWLEPMSRVLFRYSSSAALRRQVRHDFARAAAPGELPDRHRQELVPARHAAQPAAVVVPLRRGLEVMSRYQLEKLRENRAVVGHGLNILVSD